MAYYIAPYQGTNGKYSANGINWSLSAMPAIGIWSVAGPTASGQLIGINAQAGGSSSYAVSADGGSSWAAVSSFTWSGSSSSTLIVPNQGESDGTKVMFVSGTESRWTSNGTTWTLGGTLPSAAASVCYGNGRWVAYGTTTATSYSTNGGATWTAGGVLPTAGSGSDIKWNGSVFVTITSGGIATSPDGVTWTGRSPGAVGGSTNPWGMACNPATGTIVLCWFNTQGYYSTNNGVSWTGFTLPAGNWRDIAWDKQAALFVTFGYNNNTTNAASSPTGATWTARTTNAVVNQVWKIFGSAFSAILTTTASTTTSSISSITKDMSLDKTVASASISYSVKDIITTKLSDVSTAVSSLFAQIVKYPLLDFAIATNAASKSMSISIKHATSVLSTSVNATTSKIFKKLIAYTYAFSKWIGVHGNTNKAFSSTDGVTYTTRTLPTTDIWTAIASNGTIAVAIARGTANTATTTDGITWTPGTLPSSKLWTAIASNGTGFVVTALQSDSCAVSTDGINWIEVALPQFGNWVGIAHNGTLFSAITNSSIAASSTNGTTWVERTMPDNINYTAITYALSKFTAVAAGPTNLAAQSTDGINWTRITMPAIADWTQVGPGIGNPNV